MVLHILARAKVNQKAGYMTLYGLLVSAPLSHVLVGVMQKMFAGKTGLAAKIGQLLTANLVIAPIQILGKYQQLEQFPWCLERDMG